MPEDDASEPLVIETGGAGSVTVSSEPVPAAASADGPAEVELDRTGLGHGGLVAERAPSMRLWISGMRAATSGGALADSTARVIDIRW